MKKRKAKSNNQDSNMVTTQDWRQALRAPHVYRVAKSTFRVQSYYLVLFCVLSSLLVYFFIYPTLRDYLSASGQTNSLPQCEYYKYNKTYPFTLPIKSGRSMVYKIAVVSDLDRESKVLDKKDTWYSWMMIGHLSWTPSKNSINLRWDDEPIVLTTSLSMKGRGMELSELIVFDGRLLAFDDRTGIVYVIEKNEASPWLILMDGNGRSSTGFKSEWATVKDEQLYVGSMGKEWTTASGEFQHHNPQWIKVVSPRGETHSLNWVSNYERLRQTLDIEFPGYMIHESGVWSEIHKSWFFLPRRCSRERYNETRDETMACNVMLIADENFLEVKVQTIGKLIPIRGFSSFKFLPNTQDTVIVALKTEEYLGKTATYITSFTIDGIVVMPELLIMDKKFEGLEFV